MKYASAWKELWPLKSKVTLKIKIKVFAMCVMPVIISCRC